MFGFDGSSDEYYVNRQERYPLFSDMQLTDESITFVPPPTRLNTELNNKGADRFDRPHERFSKQHERFDRPHERFSKQHERFDRPHERFSVPPKIPGYETRSRPTITITYETIILFVFVLFIFLILNRSITELTYQVKLVRELLIANKEM